MKYERSIHWRISTDGKGRETWSDVHTIAFESDLDRRYAENEDLLPCFSGNWLPASVCGRLIDVDLEHLKVFSREMGVKVAFRGVPYHFSEQKIGFDGTFQLCKGD
jgi:hypothetical protein